MRISLPLLQSSYRFKPGTHKAHARGFTLIELMVAVAIIVLIVSAVLFRFSVFDSTVLLKTLSYDIALSVREAQSYSLSVLGANVGFRVPYGVTFTPNAVSYTLFAYGGSATVPQYDASASDVKTYALGRTYRITDVCVVTSGGENCGISRLDISFRRPEFTSLFYAPGVSSGSIQAGVVKVQSENGTFTGRIEIGYTGHVTVSLEE